MKWLVGIKWGAQSLVALYLSVLSGIVLALQYDMAEPFYSTGTLEKVVPFGSFWRSLHFYSSQIFFILMLVHILAVVIDRHLYQAEPGTDSKAKRPVENWLKLVLSVPVALLLLFTGYVLRGDATGRFAGVIAENIIISFPVIGGWLNAALFNISSGTMKTVLANHLIGLGVLWGYLVWRHLLRYRVSWLNHGLIVAVTLVVSVFLVAPIEPFTLGTFHVSGPWFFIGLQEMLRYFHPLLAGLVFPILGVVLLYLVVVGDRWFRLAVIGGAFWISIYSVFTVVGWLR